MMVCGLVGYLLVMLNLVNVGLMHRLMRSAMLRHKAVLCATLLKFGQRKPNAPVVGTPKKRERSDLRLDRFDGVLVLRECVPVEKSHTIRCFKIHFIRCLLSYSETG